MLRPMTVIALLLVAANLRPAITGVGPLMTTLVNTTHLPHAVAGIITTIPLITFGLVSPWAPRLARRWGMEKTLTGGLGLIAVGTLVRTLGSSAALLSGMAFIGVGAALGNVLLPSWIKRDFPARSGLYTGLYVTVMNIFAALGSGLSVPLAQSFGWRPALAIWAGPALVGLLVWLPLASRQTPPVSSTRHPQGFWRSPLTWQVTFFMGLQSLLFYASVAWLPIWLHTRGMRLADAGWLVSLMQLVSLPATLMMPLWAHRLKTPYLLVLTVAGFFLAGYGGLLWLSNPLAMAGSVILVGMGAGSSISLALAFFTLRTRTPEEAGQLSGIAQSVGYGVAASGPLIVGYLYHASGHWALAGGFLIGVTVLMTWAGLGASRDVTLDADAPPISASTHA